MRMLFLPAAVIIGAASTPVLSEGNGVELAAAYTADLLRNTHGGLATGGAYLDNLDLTASIDGGQRWNMPGLQLHAHVMYNNGREFGARYSGEAQLISNIEGVSTWRLYEIWIDYSFGKDRATSLRTGLYDLNSEFDSLESAALFLNASHGIANTLAQTGANGPSIFPVTGLALRLRHAREDFYWQLAALEGAPGRRNDPHRTGIDLGRGEGALIVAEIGASIGGFDKLAVGHWHYTARFEALDELDSTGAPVQARDNNGWYLIGQRTFYQREQSRLQGFLRLGTATARFNEYDRFAGAGLTWQGLLRGRPDDALGVAVAHAVGGAPHRRATLRGGTALERAETVLELTWRAPVTEWLTLQPTVQYVRNPNIDTLLRDALAVGLRFELAWSRS